MKGINRFVLPAILVLAAAAAGCCPGFHQASVDDLNSIKSKQDALLDKYAAAPPADEQQEVMEIRGVYDQTVSREKAPLPFCAGVPNAVKRSRSALENDVKLREQRLSRTPPKFFSSTEITALKEDLDRFVDQAIAAVQTRKR